ncbi:hypothetical protein CI109_101706 [Kwoniella shandongensis]|uniref:Uncharacterized protein n=1 Tax=Kwoniella shandongensis TaxID=1734106 RepID=A0A5M6C5G3_9TREE|nr:uncharacterized protein CI109_001171 [Kwoniella shandongensis]KAA5530368.1 hypothetical protein CI109_001171 [Kwoniella shandongensis]
MFSSPRASPAPPRVDPPAPTDISPVLAAELGMEYASLRAPNNCPRGMYITPSQESLAKWHGVFFVHRGPYAGYVLRFTITFPLTYPTTPPTVRFDSDVFHPMIDPKTKIWHPRGRLAQWKPKIDHVPHLLHSLKSSFKTPALDSVTEEEAINKQIWSLYHHSHQTFLSMTSQRAVQSTSRSVLYPTKYPQPASPTTPTRQRKISMDDSVSNDTGPIVFKELGEEGRERLWDNVKRSLRG